MPHLTIFTPTFNREKTLARCLESLQAQTDHDFEWVIVDDGSRDNTPALLDEWEKTVIPTLPFPVRIFRQANAGKHIAWNWAVDQAAAPYFLCLDSDDALLPNAVEDIKKEQAALVAKGLNPSGIGFPLVDQYGNAIGLSLTENEKPLGFIELLFRNRLGGEVTIVYRTELLRNFKFPETYRNVYFPEGHCIYRYDRAHPIHFADPVLYIYYKDDTGTVTNSSVATLSRLEKGAAITLSVMAWGPLNCASHKVFRHPLRMLKFAINYDRFRLHTKDWPGHLFADLDNTTAKALAAVAFVPGLLLCLRDKWRIAKMKKRGLS